MGSKLVLEDVSQFFARDGVQPDELRGDAVALLRQLWDIVQAQAEADEPSEDFEDLEAAHAVLVAERVKLTLALTKARSTHAKLRAELATLRLDLASVTADRDLLEAKLDAAEALVKDQQRVFEILAPAIAGKA